ncbi:MAG: hypothetical protein ABR587_13860 [Candidatus Binatia bacterium]
MILDRVEEFVDAAVAELGARAGETGAGNDSGGDDAFNRLALDLFAYQVEAIPIYRRLCELRGIDPAGIDHWTRIPAVPADIFKEGLGNDGAAGAVTFVSSGTTQGLDRPSRHVVSPRSYELYRRSSVAHFAAMAIPDSPGPMAVLVLGPTSQTHPSSSLGHMYQFVGDAFAAERTQAFDADGRLDVDAAVAWLEHAADTTQPVLILALSSTITAIFEALRTRKLALRLPADSRLVDTGGNKGGRTLSRAGILKAAWRFLHIPAYLCIGEYGMTELLSQFYDDAWRSRWSGRNDARAKVGPPWTRTVVVDPATLSPLPKGERGILKHVDLANFESVAAVQTLDLAIAKGNGFDVLGRASGAEVRGCSQLMSVLSPL